MEKDIVVLRYGHRIVRDYRVTSHCCLVARAFGAKKVEIVGDKDQKIIDTVNDINKRWGNGAEAEFVDNWRPRISYYKNKGYKVVHLTMYGISVQDAEKTLENDKKILVVIGSQKVEPEVYEKADYNVSVTTQPHSEIAALAVFLDRMFKGNELTKKFSGAEVEIEPNPKGKTIHESRKNK
ncbi:MAG: tRNA (cytidine(56)-2'-O)-methyltransferase [Candidatus Diapherotrites archaeon CG11_big_fil_rev_8_21_14_0_20_37_9]|nr:MAG: tRNA (cytidine(56)-2'-O)-methyltransferase [Candidatus Diapherotrites archaeon CG11_big_fil_rev_8_21_14_0_20_37_9]